MKIELGKIISHQKSVGSGSEKRIQKYIILATGLEYPPHEGLSITYYGGDLNRWVKEIPVEIGYEVEQAKFTTEEKKKAFIALFNTDWNKK